MMFQENVSLKPYNTFGINANAKYFSTFSSHDELQNIIDLANRSKIKRRLVLGGGSNILLTKDFDGLVMKNNIEGVDIIKEDPNHVYIKAGAGENWHGLVLYTLRRNFAGLENLSLIPGNAGASPMQNIGAYGVEIKEVFEELEAFHIKDRRTRIFTVNDCEFGYRDSIFKRKYKDEFIILNVTYRLNKRPDYRINYGAIREELERMGVKDLSIQAISQAVINIRSSKLPDPAVIGNAGSFFKNPEIPNQQFEKLKKNFPLVVGYPLHNGYTKIAAGWLIEQAGWKGFRKGDAGCHEKQALVLVNHGNANGKDIYELSTEIFNSVKKKFGIELEREVNII